MITLKVIITIDFQFESDFILLTKQMRKDTMHLEEGCPKYDIYQIEDNKFMFLETFADGNAIDNHKQTDHFKLWKEQTSKMIIEKSVETCKIILN